MNLVLFDFDDTVTKLDTTLPFGAFFVGHPRIRGRLLLLIFALGLAKFRVITNTGLKKIFARLFLRGRTRENVRELANGFYQTRMEALVDEELISTLRMHVVQGDSVYLLSANFDCLLEPLVARWSLAGVIATRAEVRAEVYTGGITGVACHGEEKLQRVIARFGRAAVEQAVAYGNRDDAPLLHIARKGYLVRRTRSPGLVGRFRRWSRIVSWKLSADDLSHVRVIELLPAPDGSGRVNGG